MSTLRRWEKDGEYIEVEMCLSDSTNDLVLILKTNMHDKIPQDFPTQFPPSEEGFLISWVEIFADREFDTRPY